MEIRLTLSNNQKDPKVQSHYAPGPKKIKINFSSLLARWPFVGGSTAKISRFQTGRFHAGSFMTFYIKCGEGDMG